MKRKYIGWIVSVVMAVSLPLSVARAAPSVAEILPPDSLGYVELPNMGVFYYLVSEIGTAAVESLEEEDSVPDAIKCKARAMLEAFNEITPLLPKSGSLGIISVVPERELVELVFVSDVSECMGILASAACKLLPLAPEREIEVRKTEHGTEVLSPAGRMPPIGYAVKDSVLYVTVGEGVLDRVLSRATADSLSQTASFKQVHQITGQNAVLSAYINVDALCKVALPHFPPKAQKFAELFGLQDIHAAGISLSADDNTMGFNLGLNYTEDAPGIPSLLSIPNTTPKGIAYVPEDFSYVTRFSMGPPAEYMKKIQALLENAGAAEHFNQGVEEMKEATGIDLNQLLASLGGEITVGVKIPDSLRIPEALACLEVKDPAYLTGMLKNLLANEAVPASYEEVEIAGKKAMVIRPKGNHAPVAPAIVVDGETMVIGISKEVLQKALAAKASGRSIASKPQFAAAMAGLPAESNIALEYIEMEQLGQLILAGARMAAARAPEEAQPIVSRAMEYLGNAVRDLEPGAEALYRTPGGLAIQSRWGTRSFMKLVRNLAAFGTKPVMHRAVQRRIRIGIEGEEPEEIPSLIEEDEENTPPSPPEE